MKKINLAIAQDIKEIKFIQKRYKNSLKWLPLNLETLLYFDQNNLDYVKIGRYISNSFHKKGILASLKITSIIDKHPFQEKSLQHRYKGIIRKFFNSAYFLIEALKCIKKNFLVNEIVLSGWNNYNDLSIKNNYIVSSIFKNLFFNRENLNLLSKIKENKNQKLYSFRFLYKNSNNKKILLSDLNYNFIRIIFSNFLKGNKIYLIDFDENKSLKKNLLKLMGVNFIKFEKKIEKKQKKIKFQKLNFTYDGKDFSKLLSLRANQIQNSLINLNSKNQAISKLFYNFRPDLIILNNVRGINYKISELSKKYKLKSILLSHGTLTKGKNKFEKIYQNIISEELINNNIRYLGLQTKLIQSSLKTIKFKGEIIKTGNIIFSEKKSENKKYFLYAVTQRDFVNMHFYGIEMFYEFYNNLKILDVISKDHSYKIKVKLHPNINYLARNLETKFKNIEFSNENIQNLISKAIATISFSSTVIDESLCSHTPVILYDPQSRYNHNFLKNNDTVNYANNKNILIKLMKKMINSKNLNFNNYIYNGNSKKNIQNNLLNLIY